VSSKATKVLSSSNVVLASFRIADDHSGLRGTRRRWGVLCRIDGIKWAGENLTKIAGVWLPEIMSLPDSLPWMESVDAKMVRAKEHLDTLHAEARVFFEITKRNFILKSNGREARIRGSSTTSRVPSRPFVSVSSRASASSTLQHSVGAR
jgi:hypothetical protein